MFQHELAVHKKKIGEVQDWFEHSFRKKHNEVRICIRKKFPNLRSKIAAGEASN